MSLLLPPQPRLRQTLARLLAAVLAPCAGCGYVGPPQPPALYVPVPPRDLRAIQYGDRILVQFTIPVLTTDGLVQTRLRGAEIYAGPAAAPFDRGMWAAKAKRYPVPEATAPGPVEKEIDAFDFLGQEIVLAVRVTGQTGRVSDWSNNAILGIDRPLDTPAGLQAANTAAGVALRWTGTAPRYRVLRSAPDAPSEADRAYSPVGEAEMPAFMDATAVYGTRYQYIVVGLSGETQQSFPSDPVSITPTDVFPPAVPAGIRVTASPRSIDLSWERNTEDDFQGYNVRRSTAGGAFELVARMLPSPAYSDAAVESGKQYRYTITAVDASGNESAPSEPVTAVAP